MDSHTDGTAGHPFGEDYPDQRTADERALDRETVLRQVGGLGDRPVRDDNEEELLRRLMDRRSPGQDWGNEPVPVQLGVVRGRSGARVLLVPNEVLVARAALDASDVREQLERAGFTEEPDPGVADCPELQERVARFVGFSLGWDELAELVSRLRASGIPVSANHVTPLAAVVKGAGGPALTTGRREHPGIEIAQAGDGPAVAVVDTGVAEEERSDSWLGRAQFPREADGSNIDVRDAFPPPGNDFLDMATGHGTFVCGVIEQVCPTARVRVYRGPDSDGVASEMHVACTIIRAVRDGADIVNLSLGGQTVDDGPPVALAAALDIVGEIEAAQGREVLLIAAAGNDGEQSPVWPAAFRRVVAVASLRADGVPAADWSSHGGWVDCSTVGEGIVSTFLPGCEDPAIDLVSPDSFEEDSWALWTGTSFSAPQVTGAVARICQESGTTPRKALSLLLAAGVPVPLFGQALVILPGT